MEDGGRKDSDTGRDDKVCRRTGSEFEVRRGGGGGNETLGGGGGGGVRRAARAGGRVRCWASLDGAGLGDTWNDGVLAATCRGFKLKRVQLETAPLPKWREEVEDEKEEGEGEGAEEEEEEEAEGTTWLKIPANRREKNPQQMDFIQLTAREAKQKQAGKQ